ncbi:MAG: hypothetical protein GY739_17730, partial [Mesoflavibacter sp.]|nr:hypothetical protein [Mesoflavibacter sp.]
SDRLGDTEFWTFLLGDEADDFFDSQPVKRAGDDCSFSPKRAAVETQDGGAVTRSAAADSGHPNGPLQGPTYYDVEFLGARQSPRFRAVGTAYALRLKNVEECADVQATLLAAFSELIERAFADGGPDDKVSMVLTHPGLRKKIGIPLSRREMLTAEKVLAIVEKFIQSGDDVSYDEQWTIEA